MARTAITWFAAAVVACAGSARADGEFHVNSVPHPSYSVYFDPFGDVNCKEFAFFHNVVPDPDTTGGRRALRDLFHLVYQRSGGHQASETRFGHAWSADLKSWTVDTAAFAVDTTWWNTDHVWSPSLIELGGRTYMFYTGVDAHGDQRIGYASTAVLDTSDTVWDPQRVMVLQASDTQWAVPDPLLYGFFTQFRDAYVLRDPEHEGRLLMFYDAHDSVDFNLNQGGLAVGIAQSDSGSVDTWHDLGYLRTTLKRTTGVPQLESPHVFPVDGGASGWRLMYTNAGSPPGENGHSTIRFEALAAGASLSDTTAENWGAPQLLVDFIGGVPTTFGWSGSEELHVEGADYLAGFTAWTPGSAGIAITRVHWNGDAFTLGAPLVTAVDEVRSPARALRMSLEAYVPGARRVTFVFESPLEIEAKLEVFDAQGRRLATPLAGRLPRGRSTLGWALTDAGGLGLPSGVYFARLSFAGGLRSASLAVIR
jgi:hypothetical protein